MTSSPTLFAVYQDELPRVVGLLNFNIMAYADDLVIIVQQKSTLLLVNVKLESFKGLLELIRKRVASCS